MEKIIACLAAVLSLGGLADNGCLVSEQIDTNDSVAVAKKVISRALGYTIGEKLTDTNCFSSVVSLEPCGVRYTGNRDCVGAPVATVFTGFDGTIYSVCLSTGSTADAFSLEEAKEIHPFIMGKLMEKYGSNYTKSKTNPKLDIIDRTYCWDLTQKKYPPSTNEVSRGDNPLLGRGSPLLNRGLRTRGFKSQKFTANYSIKTFNGDKKHSTINICVEDGKLQRKLEDEYKQKNTVKDDGLQDF